MTVGALILSAGNSTRMGFPKALLQFDEHFSFIETIIQQYQNFDCTRICTILNPENLTSFDEPAIVKLVNKNPENGRFSSLKIGFKALEDMDYIFVQNIDNPFADRNLLKSLLKGIEGFDFCVPVFENRGGHPIIVCNKIAKAAQNEPDDTNLKEFLSHYTRKNVETNLAEILLNINNEEDYIKFRKR
jgi:molybdenum cofactor cytidylyltransferase